MDQQLGFVLPGDYASSLRRIGLRPMDRAGASRSLDSHLPAAAVAPHNMNVAVLRHRVCSSEGADKGKDDRDYEEQEQPAVHRCAADDGEDDHQNN
jgi:hypothetical protein